jgi:hypothetical protein
LRTERIHTLFHNSLASFPHSLPIVFVNEGDGEVTGAGSYVVSHERGGIAVAQLFPHLPHHRVPDNPVHTVIQVADKKTREIQNIKKARETRMAIVPALTCSSLFRNLSKGVDYYVIFHFVPIHNTH